MAVDAVTAEVVSALADDGVDSLLLKGPSVADWLYDEDSRTYVDSDLLVAPDRMAAARATLERLGFRQQFGSLPHPGMEAPPSAPWQRDAFQVDLHERLEGAMADRGRLWGVLWKDRTELVVGGRSVAALGESARLVHVALHAAHHGPRAEKPLRDLRRALDRLDDASWAAAAEVAGEIGAASAFAAGLDLVPEGRALLERLEMAVPSSPTWFLEHDETPVAAGIERVREANGLGAKLAIVRHEAFPSAEFMRWWTPLARRSQPGLIAAYVWRWAFLLGHLPGALVAGRRARARAAERANLARAGAVRPPEKPH